MSEAILATFADFKTIRTRSTVQLILELPIEQADEALKALGGVPQPGAERWVGVALAPKERKSIAIPVADVDAPGFPGSEKSAGANPAGANSKKHRPFNELQLSQQAGIRTSDRDFRQYLARDNDIVAMWDSDTAADIIREHCGVTSRSELDTNDLAAQKWRKLEADYQAYRTDLAYAGSIK